MLHVRRYSYPLLMILFGLREHKLHLGFPAVSVQRASQRPSALSRGGLPSPLPYFLATRTHLLECYRGSVGWGQPLGSRPRDHTQKPLEMGYAEA